MKSIRHRRHEASVRAIGVALLLATFITAISNAQTAQPKNGSPKDENLTGPTGSTNMEIQVPAFRGLEPNLSLRYDAANGNGWVGVGWSLTGLSRIVRVSPGNGAPTFNDEKAPEFSAPDQYLLDDVELLPCNKVPAAGTPQARPSCRFATPETPQSYATKVESYQRIYYQQSSEGGTWHVWRKNGTHLTYSPRLDGDTTDKRVAAWHLTSVEDSLGNTVSYIYRTNGDPNGFGAEHLYQITYNGVSINFHSEDRPDPIVTADGTSLITDQQRLKTIDIVANGERVRAYSLSYVVHQTTTSRSLLRNILQYGRDATVDEHGNLTGGTAAPPIGIDFRAKGEAGSYARHTPTPVVEHAGWGQVYPTFDGITTPKPLSLVGFTWGDVNGDGRSDYIKVSPSMKGDGPPRIQIAVGLALGEYRAGVINEEFPWPDGAGLGDLEFRSWALDLNGDRNDDLLMMTTFVNRRMPGYDVHLHAALSNGNGTFTLRADATIPDWTYGGNTHGVMGCDPADANGDGRTDLVCVFNKSPDKPPISSIGTAMSRGDGSFEVTTTSAPSLDDFSDPEVATGDANGDGLVDVFLSYGTPCPHPGECGNYEMVIGTSLGDGEYTFKSNPTDFDGAGNLFATDINGDGRADFLRIAEKGAGYATQTLTSRPDGLLDKREQEIPQDLWKPLRARDHGVLTIGDTNGDGSTDILLASPIDGHVETECSSASSETHLVFTRIISNRDGTFNWPQSLGQCGFSSEREIAWQDMMTANGVYAPDVNGDGLADGLVASGGKTSSGYASSVKLIDDVSRKTGSDSYRALSGDVSGDGREDYVYVYSAPRSSGNILYTLIAQADGGYTTTMHQVLPGLNMQVLGDLKIGDVNGDGLADVLMLSFNKAGLDVHTLLSRGDGSWDQRSERGWANYATDNPGEVGIDTQNWKTADVNGDGKVDLLHMSSALGRLRISVMLSEGNGKWAPQRRDDGSAFAVDVPLVASNLVGWQETDVNGDGRGDLLHLEPSGLSMTVRTLISTGDGANWRYGVSQVSVGTHLVGNAGWRTGDINADGKSDAVFVEQVAGGLNVHSLVSHGNGRWTHQAMPKVLPIAESASESFADTTNWLFADINGDNRSDLLHLLPFVRTGVGLGGLRIDTLLSTGNGLWDAKGARNAWPGYDSVGKLQWRLGDPDGNGIYDLVRIGQRGFLDVSTLTSAVAPELLSAMTNGLGLRTNVTYKPSSQLDTRVGSSVDLGNCHLPLGAVLNAPTEIDQYDGATHIDHQEFKFGCARWSYTSRRFLGWAVTTTTHAASASRAALITTQTDQLDDECLVRPLETQVQGESGQLLTSVRTEYSRPDGVSNSICLARLIRTSNFNGSSVAQKSYTTFDYDDFGNATLINAVGDPANAQDDQVVEREFSAAIGPWIVGLPSTEVLRDGIRQDATHYRRTRWCYDGDNGSLFGSCPGVPTKGLITAVKQLGDDGRFRTTTFGYDIFGNQTNVTDPRGNTTRTVFDSSAHLFPEVVCNPLNQCVTQAWDTNQGQLLTVTDANGAMTQFTWDAFGNRATIKSAARGLVSFSYLDWDKPGQRRIREVSADGTPDGIWSETFLDGLNRPYHLTKEADTPAGSFGQYISYSDASNLPATRSHWAVEPVNGASTERFAYDGLGRITSQTHADGTHRTWSYGNDTTRTWVSTVDERGNGKTLFSDAFGRLIGVEESDGLKMSKLTYGYDAADQLLSIADDQGNVTVNVYNSLGYRTKTIDPDLGTWTWEWDDGGNLKTQTDARGRKLVYTYDALGRPETKTYGSGEQVIWHYDEVDHGASIGRLTSSIDATGRSCYEGRSRDITYDLAGRVARDTRCIEGHSLSMAFEFDSIGRQSFVFFPDGERLAYVYDSAGRLESIPGLAEEMTYDADDRLNFMSLIDGTSTSWTWDPSRRWLNSAITTEPEGQTLLDLKYSYEANGLVKAVAASPGRSVNYVYDGLDRLIEAHDGSNPRDTQTFSYDSLGNMLTNSAVGAYSYASSSCGFTMCGGPHAASSAGNESYEYDENGNTIAIDNGGSFVGGDRSYFVMAKEPGRRRDTLWAIAEDLLGDPELWPEIYELNRGDHQPQSPTGRFDDPNLIYPGQKLRIPNSAEHGCERSSLETIRYVVQAKEPGRRRDTLWAIAEDLLGDPERWPEIYELNRGEAQAQSPTGRFDDPNLIYPGQELRVPTDESNMGVTDGQECSGPPSSRLTKSRLSWDDDNRLITIEEGSGNRTGFSYSADGSRVKVKHGQEETYYFGSWLQRSPTGELTKFYWAGASLIASREGDTLTFHHQDHLDSTRMLTTSPGVVIARYDYAAFGAPLQTTGPGFTDVQFAGRRRDAGSGFLEMGSRFYDSTRARFLSPDAIQPDAEATQAANRYAYAFANPLGWVDPSGHGPECPLCETEGYSNDTEPAPMPTEFDQTDSGSSEWWQRAPLNYYAGPDAALQPVDSVITGYGPLLDLPLAQIAGVYNTASLLANSWLSAADFAVEVARDPRTKHAIESMLAAMPAIAMEQAILELAFLTPYPKVASNATNPPSAANNAANGPRLAEQLTLEEANAAFTARNEIHPEIIAQSREVIPGSRLNNPEVIKQLTSDGSSMTDWGKYSSPSIKSPAGDFQIHYYRNARTGKVDYTYDYKAVFNDW